MTLQQLKYLVRVAQTGSFSKASQALYVSQPTLSQQIHALEQDLAAKLFERRPHHGNDRITLTEFGRFVVEKAQAILALEESIYRARPIAQQSRVLRVGSIHAAIAPLLWEATRRCTEVSGDIRLEVHEGGSVEITDALRAGRLDIGIVADAGRLNPQHEFSYEILSRGDLSVCLPPGHPLEHQSAVTVADLAGYPFVSLGKGFVLHEVSRWYLEQIRVPTVIYTNSTEVVLEFVSRGMGLSILPTLVLYTARPNFAVVTRPLRPPDAPPWYWLVIWPKHHPLDNVEQCFVRALIAQAQRPQWFEPAPAPADMPSPPTVEATPEV